LSCDGDFLLFDSMRLRDLDAVAAIERQSFPTPYPVEAFREELAADDSRWWVLRWIGRPRHDGRPPVVAYVGYHLYDTGVHVAKIATDPRWRRRRLGEWLLLNMLVVASQQGATFVTLEVRDTNTVARQFYRKWGFVQVRRSKGHYDDTGEDGLILAYRTLADPGVVSALTWTMASIHIEAPGQ
jgi:ribosomal-protein-alanine N-acetyltransferase